MKVTMNGRDLNERVETLERREEHYFEVIQSAVYFIVGIVMFVCLSSLLHLTTGIPVDFGADRIIDAFKSHR